MSTLSKVSASLLKRPWPRFDQCVVEDKDVVTAAKQWVMDNKDNEAARTQPWDTKGIKPRWQHPQSTGGADGD